LYQAAEWIRENTEPSAVIAATDAGIIGWYSGRQTINLDGLVNTAAFQSLVCDGIGEYLQEKKVNYLVLFRDMFRHDNQIEVRFRGRLLGCISAPLVIGSDQEVYRDSGGRVHVVSLRGR